MWKNMKTDKIPIIVICGPTASGKTSLAIEMALETGAHILSADSRQVYRHLNIGTAKSTPEELTQVTQYGIDILDPGEKCDAVYFVEHSRKVIEDCYLKKIPVIVAGGTQLYVQALLNGIFQGPTGNPLIRSRLQEIANTRGSLYLHKMLERIDPETAEKLHINDHLRVIRAIEVFEISGKKISSFFAEQEREKPYNVLLFSLMRENRVILYEGIEKRVDEMIDSGFIKEVENIIGMGYNNQANSLRSIGYPEIIDFLEGKTSLERAVYLMKRNTRRFAKRQLTWLRRLQDAITINTDNEQQRRNAIQAASDFLRRNFHVQDQV